MSQVFRVGALIPKVEWDFAGLFIGGLTSCSPSTENVQLETIDSSLAALRGVVKTAVEFVSWKSSRPLSRGVLSTTAELPKVSTPIAIDHK